MDCLLQWREEIPCARVDGQSYYPYGLGERFQLRRYFFRAAKELRAAQGRCICNKRKRKFQECPERFASGPRRRGYTAWHSGFSRRTDEILMRHFVAFTFQ